MRQTVVGVFETSDEARRAQAALLDAQFQPASVRVSAGGTSRGVDEGMAYPAGSGDPMGVGGDFLDDRRASMMPASDRRPGSGDGPMERVAEFFRDLFSPEDQRVEMAHYEEAIRRGGALVAVDTADEVEETLASDILIRAGAYDLEERVMSWQRPDYAAEEGIAGDPMEPVRDDFPERPRTLRAAAMPGNVTSMDPSDPTGYVASRARASDSLDPRRADVNWTEADSLESDRLEVFPGEAGPTEADRMESDLMEARAMSPDPMDPRGRTNAYPSEADRMETDSLASARLEADRIEQNRLDAERREAARLEAVRLEAVRRETGSAQAPHRRAGYPQQRQAERVVSSREADHLLAPKPEVFLDEAGFASRGSDMTGAQAWSSTTASALSPAPAPAPATRPAPASAPSQARCSISRQVRIYSRRADDPATQRDVAQRRVEKADESMDERADKAAARNAELRDDPLSTGATMEAHWAGRVASGADELASREAVMRNETLNDYEAMDERAERLEHVDPATDVRAELGLRSPLDDKPGSRRRVLDDGAPFAEGALSEDDRRYASDDDSEYGTDRDLAGARNPRRLQNPDGSEWDHLKRVVRDAWHRMTGHHH
jgi:hypothetical protein